MAFQFFPDVRNGHDAFVGIIVGQKGSGKTSLLVDILKSVWKQKFNMIVIVSLVLRYKISRTKLLMEEESLCFLNFDHVLSMN